MSERAVTAAHPGIYHPAFVPRLPVWQASYGLHTGNRFGEARLANNPRRWPHEPPWACPLKYFDVPYWWVAEEPAVLATEPTPVGPASERNNTCSSRSPSGTEKQTIAVLDTPSE